MKHVRVDVVDSGHFCVWVTVVLVNADSRVGPLLGRPLDDIRWRLDLVCELDFGKRDRVGHPMPTKLPSVWMDKGLTQMTRRGGGRMISRIASVMTSRRKDIVDLSQRLHWLPSSVAKPEPVWRQHLKVDSQRIVRIWVKAKNLEPETREQAATRLCNDHLVLLLMELGPQV